MDIVEDILSQTQTNSKVNIYTILSLLDSTHYTDPFYNTTLPPNLHHKPTTKNIFDIQIIEFTYYDGCDPKTLSKIHDACMSELLCTSVLYTLIIQHNALK